MIQPNSKLPFKQVLSKHKTKYQIKDANDKLLVDDIYEIADAMYIEEACNNYFKAIELLNRFLKFNESNYKDLNVEFDINYDTKQFLKSIE